MTVLSKIQLFQNLMSDNNIDAYIIPPADFHQSEYVGEHFKSRAFVTGFTGSAGTALITRDSAYLWTDGRYFIQAEQELDGTGIQLMKAGNPGVPTIMSFLKDTLANGSVLGFDGRVMSVNEGLAYEKLMTDKSGSIRYDMDLISHLWENRPALSSEPAFHLGVHYTGETTASKLARIRSAMANAHATAHIITSLDDICWIFNYRGNDVKFSPLVLSYAIIHMDSVDLFLDQSKLDEETKIDFASNRVAYHPYNYIYEAVQEFSHEDSLLIDPSKLNYTLYKVLPDASRKIEMPNPSILMKACKNQIELENIRAAHIKDGVAVTKYMHWVKTNIGKLPMSELSCSRQLEEFRSQQEGFLWPSFDPICAYGDHGAIVHYRASEKSNKTLRNEGLFLNDTGGNYYEGSTDITRTFVMGPISDEQKMHFTTVTKSMLALANTKFLAGATGANLDIIARQAFWNLGLNYNHGTGHGVGYLLSIHEGPARIAWQMPPNSGVPLQEGMVFSDEPGFYVTGSHGIRIENELVVRKGPQNEYGQFLYFEVLTYAPIDLDAIEPSLLNQEEKERLNHYHGQVWEKISPHLDAEEQTWLRHYTRAI